MQQENLNVWSWAESSEIISAHSIHFTVGVTGESGVSPQQINFHIATVKDWEYILLYNLTNFTLIVIKSFPKSFRKTSLKSERVIDW